MLSILNDTAMDAHSENPLPANERPATVDDENTHLSSQGQAV